MKLFNACHHLALLLLIHASTSPSLLCTGFVVPSKSKKVQSNTGFSSTIGNGGKFFSTTSSNRNKNRSDLELSLVGGGASASSSSILSRVVDIRGGASVSDSADSGSGSGAVAGITRIMSGIIPMIIASLQSGSSAASGIVSLWAIASAVIIPLTMYRQAFSFSVGYGYSVMAMGVSLLAVTLKKTPFAVTSPAFLLATAVIFYGFRLGSYLLLRNATVPSKAKRMKEFDTTPQLKRIPLALSVALFYAFMTSPVLFALQTMNNGSIAMVGAVIAWVGALTETIADGHKFIAKRSTNKNDDGEDDKKKTYVGPTGGLYRLCRHPNFLGEITFWTGLFIGGIPSFTSATSTFSTATAWGCSSLGLIGIVSLMKGATKRLDKTQEENYAGQAKYDAYKQKVTSPLIPFMSGV